MKARLERGAEAAFVLAALCACSTAAKETPDAGSALPKCAFAVEADGSFGVRLSSEAIYSGPDGGWYTITETAGLYFPDGRKPGGRMIVARNNWPYDAVRTFASTTPLDALGQTSVQGGGVDGTDWGASFALQEPKRGLLLEGWRNWADWNTDIVKQLPGTGQLCPIAMAFGASELHVRVVNSESVTPLGPIVLVPNGPLDPTTLQLTATASGKPLEVDVTVSTQTGAVEVRAKEGAFPPNAEIVLDGSAWRDVLGNVIDLCGAPSMLKTTSVVTDPSFETDPPAGSFACTLATCQVVNGTFRNEAASCGKGTFEIALEAPAGSTRIRARLSEGDGDFTVVDAKGRTAKLEAPQPDSREWVATLPSTGPVWLVWGHYSPGCRPQRNAPVPKTLSIDEVVFE